MRVEIDHRQTTPFYTAEDIRFMTQLEDWLIRLCRARESFGALSTTQTEKLLRLAICTRFHDLDEVGLKAEAEKILSDYV